MHNVSYFMRLIQLLQSNCIIQPRERRISAINQFRPALEHVLAGVDTPASEATRS